MIEVSKKLSAPEGLRVRLACLHRVTTGSGKNRSTREDLLWEDDKVIVRDLLEDDPQRSGFPVLFEIPASCESTDLRNAADCMVWRLEAKAKLPGADYGVHFDVPVFKTAEVSAAPAGLAEVASRYEAPSGPYQPPAHCRIQVKEDFSGECEILFPAARNVGALFVGFLFGAIWTFFLWLMLAKGAPILFPIVFGMIDVLIVVALLDGLLRSTRVRVDPAGLTIAHRWILAGATKRVPEGDLAAIVAVPTSQMGSTHYYGIRVVLENGGRLSAGSGLRSKKEAEWLIAKMLKALGRKPDAGARERSDRIMEGKNHDQPS